MIIHNWRSRKTQLLTKNLLCFGAFQIKIALDRESPQDHYCEKQKSRKFYIRDLFFFFSVSNIHVMWGPPVLSIFLLQFDNKKHIIHKYMNIWCQATAICKGIEKYRLYREKPINIFSRSIFDIQINLNIILD